MFSVRVCARPVLPVMMRLEPFSVSTLSLPSCLQSYILHMDGYITTVLLLHSRRD